MKKILALVLSICLLAISLSPISAFAATENNFMQAIDYSVLTNCGWHEANDGVVPETDELFTTGIWADSRESLGIDETQGHTMVKGMLPQDSNGDTYLDHLIVATWKDLGAYVTFGFNKQTNFTDATALAVHLDCVGSRPNWAEGEIGNIKFTLYDTDGNAYEMAAKENAPTTAKSYFVNVGANTAEVKNISTQGYASWVAKSNGWYIVDLSAFGNELDVSKLAKVKVAFDTRWDSYTTFGSIGFVKNVADFVYDTTGIDIEEEPAIENNFMQANDYSVLTNCGWHEANDGVVPETDELFTTGIWADSRESLGIDETQGHTMVKGMLPQDANGDTYLDRILVATWKDLGAYVTFGFNKQTDFTDATALAVHLDCVNSRPNWAEGEIGNIKFTLYDTDGNAYEMAAQADAPTAAKSYFLNVGAGTSEVTVIGAHGYANWIAKSNGWYIVDLAAFGDALDVSKLAKVKVAFDTRWDSYTTFGSIGFVKDVKAFAKEVAGIKIEIPEVSAKPVIPAESGYRQALNLQTLTPGSYRDTEALGWAGIIPTDAEIITEGIWVDAEGAKGFGDPATTGKTNIHGFIAEDYTNDGKTDVISAIPNDNLGVAFTLGFNTENDFAGTNAVAVHIDCDDIETLWNGSEELSIKLTFYDSEDNEYPVLAREEISEGSAYSYYVTLDDKNVVKRDVNVDGYSYWKGNRDGWYIIDLAAYGEYFYAEDMVKVKISAASWWQSNMNISDIAFLDDADDFVYYLVNDEIYTPTINEPQIFAKGSSVIKLVGQEGYQYKLGDGEWSASTVFEGLMLGETYTIYSYIPATSSANESEIVSTTVTLYLEGDTDHSGAVDSTDLVDVRRHILNKSTTKDVFAADANLDGEIDIFDLVRMKKAIAE